MLRKTKIKTHSIPTIHLSTRKHIHISYLENFNFNAVVNYNIKVTIKLKLFENSINLCRITGKQKIV